MAWQKVRKNLFYYFFQVLRYKFQYIINREELMDSSNALFEVVKNGALKIQVNQQYSLADTQRAHEDLESRLTTGSTVLIP